MAGDWLKMEASTPEKGEVLAITAQMGWDDADLTVGKLFRLWRWFDQHTVDGNAPRVTSALLDRIVGVPGFCEAVRDSGWLVISDAGVSLPKFDLHNGNTAKSRALTAKRVAKHKAGGSDGNGQGNAAGNAGSVSGALPREEKRREEEDQELDPKAAPSGQPAEATKAKADRAERLAVVTEDAIETFNSAKFTVAKGGRVPNVTKVNREKRRQQVGRAIKVIREICAEEFGAPEITRQFWSGYWQIVNADAFASGRQAGTGAHSNWRPDFEYLTRPETITSLYERAESAS